MPWQFGSWKGLTDWPEHGMGPPPHVVLGPIEPSGYALPAEPTNLSCKLSPKLYHHDGRGYTKMGEDANAIVVDLGKDESSLMEIFPDCHNPYCALLSNNLKFSHPDLGVFIRTVRKDWMKENCPNGQCEFSVRKLNDKVALVEGQLKEFALHVRSH